MAVLFGGGVGVVTAFAGDTLLLLALWPLAAALAGGAGLVAIAHLLRQRTAATHLAAAALFALAWLAADRAGEAWLFRLHQTSEVGAAGLLLADHAVLHDTDHPADLVDAALLAETGASGVLGAARVQLRAGVPMLRVLRSTRVLRVPVWGHILWLALRAAMVAVLVARALEQLRLEPTCARCGAWLRRREIGTVDEASAAELAAAWATGERRAPTITAPTPHTSRHAQLIVVLEDTCPHGHSAAPGYALRRPRGRGLGRRRPGPIAQMPPLLT